MLFLQIFLLTTEDDKQFIEMNYQRGVIEFIVKDKVFLDKVRRMEQGLVFICPNSL